jgi:hypothetical protein
MKNRRFHSKGGLKIKRSSNIRKSVSGVQYKDKVEQLQAENKILEELIYGAWEDRMPRDGVSLLIEQALKGR